ncbi:hypothetical protein BDD12DRAFT_192182 [Trichophaea hybrida]|nr:hypothetical protein BDD12DRAFT_192182 [Trichophaea hybrida]
MILIHLLFASFSLHLQSPTTSATTTISAAENRCVQQVSRHRLNLAYYRCISRPPPLLPPHRHRRPHSPGSPGKYRCYGSNPLVFSYFTRQTTTLEFAPLHLSALPSRSALELPQRAPLPSTSPPFAPGSPCWL